MPKLHFLLLVAIFGGLGAACARGVRCYQNGIAPPFHRRSPQGDLLVSENANVQSGDSCPLTRPPDNVGCMLTSRGDDRWDDCLYEKTDSPCNPHVCTCQRTDAGAGPVFFCHQEMMFE